MFLDASAVIGILAEEKDWLLLQQRIEQAERTYVSPLSIWESTLGLMRQIGCPFEQAESSVRSFVDALGSAVVQIDGEIGSTALEASRTYGRGRHPARLNFGDCFAYACAKILSVPLLAKGNDFPHTDIELA